MHDNPRVAVNLSSSQRSVVSRATARARLRHASPRETKALIEALGVESNFTDLSGGDRDSSGALQQRPSQGWGPASESLETDVDQFLSRARAANRGGGSAGELAQAVQRSAFPARYDARSGEADALLGSAGAPGAARSAPKVATPAAAAQSPGQSLAAAVLAQQLAEVPRRPVSVGLATPAVAAAPVFAQGSQQVVSQASPRQSPGEVLAAQLAAVSAAGDGSATAASASPVAAGSGARGAVSAPVGSSKAGRVKITGPDPGRIKPSVLAFARKVSAVAGESIVGSDGSGHSRLTVDGNVSQHSTGNATDVPATGAHLVRLGQAALIAAGMPRAKARKQTGGLFSFPHGVQVIFNTHLGGDHTTHLHISHG